MGRRALHENRPVQRVTTPPNSTSIIASLNEQLRRQQEDLEHHKALLHVQQERIRVKDEQICRLLEKLEMRQSTQFTPSPPVPSFASKPTEDTTSRTKNGHSTVSLGHASASRPATSTDAHNKRSPLCSVGLSADTLPRFSGSSSESIDLWIEHVSRIKERCNASDATLLAHLPVLLEGSARDWYRGLAPYELSLLTTWRVWTDFLRHTFGHSDYRPLLLSTAPSRTLQPDETLVDYFLEKSTRVRQSLGENVEESYLVKEIVEGLPCVVHKSIAPRLSKGIDLQGLLSIMADAEFLRDPEFKSLARYTQKSSCGEGSCEEGDRDASTAPFPSQDRDNSVYLRASVKPCSLSMSIDTDSHAPISLRSYRATPSERLLIEKELKMLEAQGIIEASTSPWAAPVAIVHKKETGTCMCMCVDYSRLNAITTADDYSIPQIDYLFTRCSGKKWFSVLNVDRGFYCIPLATVEDREKTAFITHVGLKQFTRMPYGLKNGPRVFQRLMDRVLGKYRSRAVAAYQNIVIVCSDTYEAHGRDCAIVLGLIKEAGLRLNMKKTQLICQEITAFGLRISGAGVGVAEEKIEAVAEWETPTTVEQIQRYFGIANHYRRFVRDLATIAHPLTKFFAKGVEFTWRRKQETAFESLKSSLIRSPFLVHPNFTKPFRVRTDVSEVGLSGVLSQRNGKGQEVIVYYISRHLSKEEQNYETMELECLAIAWAFRKLDYYVNGAKIELVTEPSALKWLDKFRNCDMRNLHWALEIEDFRKNMQVIPRTKSKVGQDRRFFG